MERERRSLPPYLKIDAENAWVGLGEPVTTARFEALARACSTGRRNLVGPRRESFEDKRLRKFSTWEITHYLIPVAPGHFRRVLRTNPHLPQGESDTEGGAKWFSLEEVLSLRRHFAAEGAKSKSYLPYRPESLPAKIVSVANFKAGVGKTSTAANLAMSAALDGYRVLVIDLDSQGSLTSIFDGQIENEWGTVFPLIARHYARHLQRQNQARMDRGDAPIPLDDTLTKSLKVRAQDMIQATHWPSVDLIGAQLNLYRAEFQIPIWRMRSGSWSMWEALRDTLVEDQVLERYDVVLIDTPPALGHLTINGLTAADILLVTLGASFAEFDSTERFFDMLHTTFSSIEETENTAARALGRPEMAFSWDALQIILTRYDSIQQGEMAALMQACLGTALAPHRQGYTTLLSQAGDQVGGIYEVDYRNFNRETYARARETFDATYADFKRLLIGAWRRDEEERSTATAQTLDP